MLSRSASGPAGLSINTGAANNMFGSSSSQQQSQPPAAGGLFGSSSAQPQQSNSSSSLFGSTTATTSQSQPAPSLFGNTTATSTPQQQTGGGLFGSSMAAQTPKPGGLFGSTTTPAGQPQGGGLFGGGSAPASQPAQGGGLFGATPASQPQQMGGGLFGGSTTAAQPAQGGLWGGATQQQPAQGSGLFGGSTAQQPKPGGLFGGGGGGTTTGTGFGQSQIQQQTGGGLFGRSAPAQGGGLFSNLNQPAPAQPQGNGAFFSGRLGQSQQQVVPGVRIDLSNIKPTTRYNDLQEDLQKQIEHMDKTIQGFIKQKHELDAFLPAHGEQINAIPGDVKFVSRKYAGVDSAMGADLQAIRQLKNLVDVDAEQARLSFAVVDNLTLPMQYHSSGLNRHPGISGANNADGQTDQDLVNYFSKTAGEMDEQIKKFQKNVKEIEVHLGGVQASIMEQAQRIQANRNGTSGGAEDKIVELAAVLREFEGSILHVAGTVGGAREGVTELQLGDLRGRSTNGIR